MVRNRSARGHACSTVAPRRTAPRRAPANPRGGVHRRIDAAGTSPRPAGRVDRAESGMPECGYRVGRISRDAGRLAAPGPANRSFREPSPSRDGASPEGQETTDEQVVDRVRCGGGVGVRVHGAARRSRPRRGSGRRSPHRCRRPPARPSTACSRRPRRGAGGGSTTRTARPATGRACGAARWRRASPAATSSSSGPRCRWGSCSSASR